MGRSASDFHLEYIARGVLTRAARSRCVRAVYVRAVFARAARFPVGEYIPIRVTIRVSK